MDELRRNLRVALRGLSRSPGFACTAALLLALGVGVNATIYRLVDAVLLRPLPVERPERLVESGGRVSFPDFLELREGSRSLSGVAAWETTLVKEGDRSEPRLLIGGLITRDFFDVLGVRLPVGRPFLPGEDLPGGNPAVTILGHDFWQSTFAGDPGILGRQVSLNGHSFTVVGVAAEGFRGAHLDEPVDLWLPLAAQPLVTTGFLAEMDLFQPRTSRWLRFIGRLRDGAAPEQAQAELDVLTSRWERETSLEPGELQNSLVPLTVAAGGARSREDLVRFLGLLASVVALVLLIACANLTHLLLVRAIDRTNEMKIRFALGASRAAVLRQLLIEMFLVAVGGALLALLLASWTLKALTAFELPGGLPVEVLDLGLDLRLLAAVFGLSLAAGGVCGGVGAFYLIRAAAAPRLTVQRGTAGPGSARLRGMLLALQIALCLPLLIGGGLLLRSIRAAVATDLGFDSRNLVILELDLGVLGYEDVRARQLYDQLLERLGALPDVRSAGMVLALPLGSFHWRTFPDLEGYDPVGREKAAVHPNVVGADYFRTLGIPVVSGRGFSAQDTLDSPQVAVVNETLARRFWPGGDPLGRRITPFPGQMDLDLQVVGVVRDTQGNSLTEEPVPVLYVPFSQQMGSNRLLGKVHVLARTGDNPERLLSNLRAEIRALDPGLPMPEARTFDSQLFRLLLPQHFGLRLLGSLGVLAVLLSCVGLYGAVEVALRARRRDLAVHMALGAQRRDVVWLTLRQTLVPVGAGLIGGLGLALLATRSLQAFLYGVPGNDPATFLAASAVLLGAALAATYIPARRAGRIDPVVALRHG